MRILIVDDEPHIIRALTLLFEKSGYNVCTAYNGPDGLAKLRTRPPDIAIIDIMMPGMTGLELLQAWKEHMPAVAGPQFLVLTASCDDHITAAIEGFDNVQLVKKPFSPSRILRLVQDLAATSPASYGPV
jgi:CheY-like chemotaxis protein